MPREDYNYLPLRSATILLNLAIKGFFLILIPYPALDVRQKPQ